MQVVASFSKTSLTMKLKASIASATTNHITTGCAKVLKSVVFISTRQFLECQWIGFQLLAGFAAPKTKSHIRRPSASNTWSCRMKKWRLAGCATIRKQTWSFGAWLTIVKVWFGRTQEYSVLLVLIMGWLQLQLLLHSLFHLLLWSEDWLLTSLIAYF